MFAVYKFHLSNQQEFSDCSGTRLDIKFIDEKSAKNTQKKTQHIVDDTLPDSCIAAPRRKPRD